MRLFAAACVLFCLAAPAHGQYLGLSSAGTINHRLHGQVIDYTHNGFMFRHDNRIFSRVLNQPRDMYVYLPPGYDPCKAYPLLVYFHIARVDEHEFVGSGRLIELDRMIAAGEFPPTIVVCPDGTITGQNRFMGEHSFYVNGVKGCFEDYILMDVIPFVTSHYRIRPEREAHAILGISGGGYGGLSIAIRHRDYFGSIACLSAPVNLLYSNCHNDILEDFSPTTYREKTNYNPNEIVGRFNFGLKKVRARKYIEPIFGSDPAEVSARIHATNPANLIYDTGLQPGELAIYLHYAGRDGYNFDAQNESFVWLASQRGIGVTVESYPTANHTIAYFRRSASPAFVWLARHLPGPVNAQ